MKLVILLLCGFLALCGDAAGQSRQIRGRVLDAATHEPIAKALVSIRSQQIETTTNDVGEFTLAVVPAGRIELYVSTVGYTLLKREIETSDVGGAPLELLLGQEPFKRTDSVTVVAEAFEPLDVINVSEHTLNNTELKNVANVLVNDPLRSVQTLPGVATGDDFNAEFAVRGSGFRKAGFYIDGVLTDKSFHTVRDVNDGGSLTVLNGDLVDSLTLFSSGAPARYGDRTGAVLTTETRYGSAKRLRGRADISATGMSYSAEGPIGNSEKLSWIAAVRKSYAAWLVRKLSDDPNFVDNMGLTDVQGNLSYAPTSHHRFTLSTLLGSSSDNREEEKNRLGTNSFLVGEVKSVIVNGRWRWLLPRLVSQTSVYISDNTAKNINKTNELLFKSLGKDIGFRYDASYQASAGHRLESGVFVRRLYENSQRRRFTSGSGFTFTSHYDTATWQPGVYLQDTWKVSDRILISGGGRFDTLGVTHQKVWLPRGSVSYRIFSPTTITASYGQFAQFPDFADLYGDFGVPSLRAERSTHRAVAVEHRFTERLRGRIELYDHKERSLIFSEATEPRIVEGKVVRAKEGPFLRNSLEGYSRGIEFYLQRRSANRLSGWISYALGFARLRDSFTNLAFDGDFDQRHTVNGFATYRLSRALNVSAKFRYGSNFPVAGFYTFSGSRLILTSQRNGIRLPGYSRLDLRADYAFHFERWKLTLNTEVANVLARKNVRFTDLDSVLSSGQVQYSRQSLLPFLPSVGIGIEF